MLKKHSPVALGAGGLQTPVLISPVNSLAASTLGYTGRSALRDTYFYMAQRFRDGAANLQLCALGPRLRDMTAGHQT